MNKAGNLKQQVVLERPKKKKKRRAMKRDGKLGRKFELKLTKHTTNSTMLKRRFFKQTQSY